MVELYGIIISWCFCNNFELMFWCYLFYTNVFYLFCKVIVIQWDIAPEIIIHSWLNSTCIKTNTLSPLIILKSYYRILLLSVGIEKVPNMTYCSNNKARILSPVLCLYGTLLCYPTKWPKTTMYIWRLYTHTNYHDKNKIVYWNKHII